MVKDMTLKVTRDRTIVEQIYELTKYQMHWEKCSILPYTPVTKIQYHLLKSGIQDGV